MGSITPLLTSSLVTQGINLAISQASKQSSNNQALEQLKERQALDQANLKADADLKRKNIALENQIKEQDRKSALRRAVSKQRANFGAQGIASDGGGSAEAVLLGLVEDSQIDKGQSDRIEALKQASIDQDLAQNKSLNVLQRTQLQERNNLKTISNFGNDLLGFF